MMVDLDRTECEELEKCESSATSEESMLAHEITVLSICLNINFDAMNLSGSLAGVWGRWYSYGHGIVATGSIPGGPGKGVVGAQHTLAYTAYLKGKHR
jgi:hypothetical protein